ncbi:hypothetical protein I553_10431 [Mycobacterium xenopi 4042]|uniref:Uncharacterized protein n=1 Tax=Mycobacterium xenopi 4042 TaxID=1299334 RepID=X8C8N4_MYCXE|nr:hypothetical protein I553_10431 [Mycobacterium xenopi 4042]
MHPIVHGLPAANSPSSECCFQIDQRISGANSSNTARASPMAMSHRRARDRSVEVLGERHVGPGITHRRLA